MADYDRPAGGRNWRRICYLTLPCHTQQGGEASKDEQRRSSGWLGSPQVVLADLSLS